MNLSKSTIQGRQIVPLTASAATGLLLTHPLLGKPVDDIDDPNLRDVFIPFGQGGYWLRYQMKEDVILIIQIWHGRENRNTNP